MMMKEAAAPIIGRRRRKRKGTSNTSDKLYIHHLTRYSPHHDTLHAFVSVPFPTSALAASSTSSTSSKTISINSCEDMTPEELLRQHRLRFKSIRQRNGIENVESDSRALR
ncbi:hypothetical protein Ae201684P_008996 [Aphanomyces euteiches]|nr:hypothetical protein Ae201684P_008996 [Aphanomyces euteiches]